MYEIPPWVGTGDDRFGDDQLACRYIGPGCVTDYLRDQTTDAGPTEPADPNVPDADPVTITLSDIASFVPLTAQQFMQPEGWMVVGLPTNFYAEIDRHLVEGELLGENARVRFTPIGYTWFYGDGNSTTVGEPGASWGELGLGEFDETSTSHTYTQPGEYTITLEVAYVAEYQFAGSPFILIDGVVTAPSLPLTATAAADASTVLVDRDCVVAPRGPGC